MREIKTHREIWGVPFPVNAEWDAGLTPFYARPAGRWTVRRTEHDFIVFFHSYEDGREEVLSRFPPTEEGEREAKRFALSLVEKAHKGEVA